MSKTMRNLGVPLLLPLLAMPAWTAPRVTFNKDIAPIIYSQCSVCHRPGESAPFSLLSFEDVKRRASQIADVTKRRYMPPWQPEAGFGDFAEQRRLTDVQIQLIQDWVAEGELPGPTANAPTPQSSAQSGSWVLLIWCFTSLSPTNLVRRAARSSGTLSYQFQLPPNDGCAQLKFVPGTRRSSIMPT